jgi:mannosyltransferase
MNDAPKWGSQPQSGQKSTKWSRFEGFWPLELSNLSRYEYLLLAAVTLLALLLRVYKLGEWSFWIDEIFTINRAQAQYASFESMLRNIPPHTNWVPVSLLATSAALKTLGVSEWTARLAPAVIGILTIPILYFPTKRIFGTRVALISALLLAVSPWHVTWSQNARFYTALLLLYNLAIFAAFYGLESNRRWLLMLSLPLFYLAMSERLLASYMVPVIAVYVILVWRLRFSQPPGLNRKNLIIVFIPAIGGLMIELYSLLTTGSSRFFGDAFFFGNAVDSPLRILTLMFFSIGLPVVVLALFSGGWLVWQRSRPGLFLLVSATLPVALLVGFSPWMFTVERYAFITLPAWLTLAALAVEELLSWVPQQGQWLVIAVLSLILADSAGTHLMYYQLNNGNRLDWRGAFAYVQAHKADDDLIVSTWPEIGQYYLDSDQEIISLADVNPAQLVSEDRTLWFVIDSEAVWFAPEIHRQWVENYAELLFVWYLRVREQMNLKVYRFTQAENLNG